MRVFSFCSGCGERNGCVSGSGGWYDYWCRCHCDWRATDHDRQPNCCLFPRHSPVVKYLEAAVANSQRSPGSLQILPSKESARKFSRLDRVNNFWRMMRLDWPQTDSMHTLCSFAHTLRNLMFIFSRCMIKLRIFIFRVCSLLCSDYEDLCSDFIHFCSDLTDLGTYSLL